MTYFIDFENSSLTTKLPFDDDEFDHVHIQSIAKGVPENKVEGFILECPALLT